MPTIKRRTVTPANGSGKSPTLKTAVHINGQKLTHLKTTTKIETVQNPVNPQYELPSFPDVATLKTPPWFKVPEDTEVDVSIIIPLFNSNKVIQKQIDSWLFENDGFTKEIIYVDDACPHNSHQVILNAWVNKKADIANGIGKILVNKSNVGFGLSCNVGAAVARGRYLLFLNADTTVTPNWLAPMLRLIENDPSIGIVGNMQVHGDYIDSAGSEWSWETTSFSHIGRNVYKGKKIERFKYNDCPADLKIAQERQMITGCCFVIPKDLFLKAEGFDANYKIGYWEDSDLCMKVKSAGYKIFYEPESVIHHSSGHSGAGRYSQANKGVFIKKWLNDEAKFENFLEGKGTLTADPKRLIKKKTVGCVIACNEEEFLEVSVDSLSSVIDEWIFVVGGNNYALSSGMCDKRGYPNDATLDIARNLQKKYGGYVIEPPGRPWRDKVEMRNAYAQYLKPGNWMWMLDGDEVYKQEQLWRITELMQTNDVLIMKFWLFWNNIDTVGIGKWDCYPQERLVKWKEGYGYRGSNHLHVSTNTDQLACKVAPTYRGNDKLFYHYSWVRPIEKIRQKLLYYKYQANNYNDTYVDNVFLKWRSDPRSVQGRTHPMGGGETMPFSGLHPTGIIEMNKLGRFKFE